MIQMLRPAPAPHELQWPDAWMQEEPPVVERVEIGKQTYDWRVAKVYMPVKLEETQFLVCRPMYLQRLDAFQVPYIGKNGYELPDITSPLTSACIFASMLVLKQQHLRHLVYEHEGDMVVDYRSIIQSTAISYNLDPSEMMGQYPAIRKFLLHQHLHVPEALETSMNFKRGQAHLEVKI